MNQKEFESICLACARDLEAVYGPGLVDYVQAALAGGARWGEALHMSDWGKIDSLPNRAQMMVEIIRIAEPYLEMKRKVSTAGAEPLQLSINDDGYRQELHAEIENFGSRQREMALRLSEEICTWLEKHARR